MRKQLITWLVDDIAPSIRQSGDPKGEILKFANEQNLAPSQVQALGQLYNTAKTLSYLEKAGAHRGDNFPILDVEDMLGAFTAIDKKASCDIAISREDDEVDPMDLSKYFEGTLFTTPGIELVEPDPKTTSFKQACIQIDSNKLIREFASEARDTYIDQVKEAADTLVRKLRENDAYTFEELDADVWSICGDAIRPTMAKLAKYCIQDGWPVKQASAPGHDRMVDDPEDLISLCRGIWDNTFRIKAAQDVLDAPNPCAAAGGITGAPLVTSKDRKEPIVLKSAGAAAPPTASTSDMEDQLFGGKQPETMGGDTPPEEMDNIELRSRDNNRGRNNDRGRDTKKIDPAKIESKKTAPSSGSGIEGMANSYSGALDSVAGHIGRTMEPAATKAMFGYANNDQKKVDNGMQDVQHIALLQHLLGTDEILAEADPEKVIGIFNTVRNMAPQLAGDVNVMRVLLRSAVQHEGISPFDLKGILETELNKQKLDVGQRSMADHLYKDKPLVASKV